MTKRNVSFGWVEAALRYGGVFGAPEKIIYREIFGLSEPTVSRHQAEFEVLFEQACGPVFVRDSEGRVQGGRLTLDENAALPETAVFPAMPSLERWLEDTLGGSAYFTEDLRRPDPDTTIMRPVVRAIRTETPLLITVMSLEDENSALVSPHAIFRIKGWLLMRAYVHLTSEYRDFVLARITRAALAPGSVPYVGPRLDDSWARISTVVTRAEGIGSEPEHGFGFEDTRGEDCREVQVREALLPYLRGEIVKESAEPDGDGDAGGEPGPGRV